MARGEVAKALLERGAAATVLVGAEQCGAVDVDGCLCCGEDCSDRCASLHDSATVMVRFAGGATGTIQVSGARLVGDWPIAQVSLFGDEGSLKLDFGLDTDGRVS